MNIKIKAWSGELLNIHPVACIKSLKIFNQTFFSMI